MTVLVRFQPVGGSTPVNLHLDGPGTCLPWAQFALADDHVVTAEFTVEAP